MKYCAEITVIIDAPSELEAEKVAYAIASIAERKDHVNEAWMSYLNESRD